MKAGGSLEFSLIYISKWRQSAPFSMSFSELHIAYETTPDFKSRGIPDTQFGAKSVIERDNPTTASCGSIGNCSCVIDG